MHTGVNISVLQWSESKHLVGIELWQRCNVHLSQYRGLYVHFIHWKQGKIASSFVECSKVGFGFIIASNLSIHPLQTNTLGIHLFEGILIVFPIILMNFVDFLLGSSKYELSFKIKPWLFDWIIDI